MLRIDVTANSNHWRSWHPAEKVIPAGLLLVVTLVASPWPTAPLVLGATAAAATIGARIPIRSWMLTLTWPAGFITAGAIGIALLGGDGPGFLPLTVTAVSLREAAATAARSMAGVSVMVLVGSTTPMVDLIALMRTARVPAVVTDLMSSTYRLIFDLLGMSQRMRQAQAARLGHQGFAGSLRGAALIATAVLRRSLQRARRLQIGLDARGYDGEMRVLSASGPLVRGRLVAGVLAVAAIGLVSTAARP